MNCSSVHFQKLIGVCLFILVFAGCSTGKQERPPNIILIMADDMGFSDISCFGSEIATPNIDALAEDGLTFTQFYNTGRCCPSRASLLTGLYSHRAGIGQMVGLRDHPSYLGYLNDQCLTIAEALQPAGYHSYLSGKWHVGSAREHWPLQRGFEKFYGSNTSQGHYFRVYEGRLLLHNNREVDTPEGWYATDAFTDSTIAFIERHQETRADEPFFMYLAYTAPHWPIHALPEDLELYEGKYAGGYDSVRQVRYGNMKRLALLNELPELSPLDETVPDWSDVNRQDEARKMEVYAAMIHRMDQGIGKIMQRVKDLGIERNTVVVFLSDNGGCAEEIHRSEPGAVIGETASYESIGLPWGNVANTPFRKFKSWVHEGGISTPLIIKYPQMIKEGSKTSEVGHIIDLMPTFLELAGLNYPEAAGGKQLLSIDGKSLVPVFTTGTREGHEVLFWEHEGKRAVRKGQWKLVSAYNSEWELYDIANDRDESDDLSGQHPDKVNELRRLYEDWATRNQVLPWDSVRALKRLD